MEINDDINTEISQFKDNKLCQICQTNEGEYECSECPKFKILCEKCDNFIHSMEIKSNHERKKISSINNIISNNKTKSNNKIEKIEINNDIPQQKISPITNNYIEQVRLIYEQDKKNLLEENNCLERKLNTNQKLYKHKINDLQNKLDELKTKSQNNLQMMKDEHDMDIKQLIKEKDFEINYLINNNKELEKINNELKEKLKNHMAVYSEDQSKYNDTLTTLEFTLKKLQKENLEIKEYYENKINFLYENFNLEKNKLINSYELDIDQLNKEYIISKDKYINYFNKRDIDIKNNSNNNNYELNKLKEKIKNLSIQVNELRNRKDELVRINNELIFDNNNLNENFERVRKELKYEKNKKELEKEKIKSTQKDFYKAKQENKRITKRGRPIRSLSVKY